MCKICFDVATDLVEILDGVLVVIRSDLLGSEEMSHDLAKMTHRIDRDPSDILDFVHILRRDKKHRLPFSHGGEDTRK